MLLSDKIQRQLQLGGYREVSAPKLPCRVLIRRDEAAVYAVCLAESGNLFRAFFPEERGGTEGDGMHPERERAAEKLDALLFGIERALEASTSLPCQMLALVISEDPGQDKTLAAGTHAVWLMDLAGRRIVFDNQPSGFDGVERLLETKVYPWSGLQITGSGGLPWATLLLVLVNLLVQAVVAWQEWANGYSELMGAMVLQIGRFWQKPEYYRLLTSAFLHFGWSHLFNNMLVLLFLGKTAERVAGKGRFLISYLICAVGANAASVIWYIQTGQLAVATAGASGAVFGVAGMVLVWVVMNHGRLDDVSTRQIVWMIAFTVYHGIAESGINNCAHIAGVILGILCGIVIWVFRRRPGHVSRVHSDGCSAEEKS